MIIAFIAISLRVFLTSASSQDLESLFESYLNLHKKSYSPGEKQIRFNNFKTNHESIQKSKESLKGCSLKLGPNADKSSSDFTQIEVPFHGPFQAMQEVEVPDFIDWVKRDKVSKLRSAQSCEASWVFAAVDTIESLISITNQVPAFQLSPQQFISCSDSYGNSGCSSGTIQNSFLYAESNVLCTEFQYPFQDKSSSCKRKFFCKNKISSFVQLPRFNETQLKLAVASQPVAVMLNLTSTLLNYEGGIISKAACGQEQKQGYFVLVGYGSLAGKDFWVVRSYWGEDWGLGGYGLIERDDSNDLHEGACGVAFAGFIPVVTVE